jgi:hypothetical protein
VYVSFYKDIGALAGAAVAGPADVIAEVREWRQRHGGTLYSMWPHAASALANLRLRLPRMPAYRDHALRSWPRSMTCRASRSCRTRRTARCSTSCSTAMPPRSAPPLTASRAARDLDLGQVPHDRDSGRVADRAQSVGDATLEWTPAEFRGVIARLLSD